MPSAKPWRSPRGSEPSPAAEVLAQLDQLGPDAEQELHAAGDVGATRLQDGVQRLHAAAPCYTVTPSRSAFAAFALAAHMMSPPAASASASVSPLAASMSTMTAAAPRTFIGRHTARSSIA